ncbi:homeobox-domain-containing protein [Russula earlei]|uniref:Homeobox-domain-containing protein n=1 Tax=Russula earlei TaxID=71964 RepID=A0ACC0UHL2_9AGAM|nr:homeobox-domain-containing protein [Russula earlei]
MSHPNYNSHHGRPLRPSPTGGDSHSGSLYSEQGRTTLPPLTIAFPTSDPPVSNNNYPNPFPTQQRSTPVSYEQTYYTPPQQQAQPGYPAYPSYQQLSDTRYPGGQTYGSYNRSSPSSSSADPRRLPPLNVPREDRFQGYYASHIDLQIPPSSDMRSPHAVYSPASSYPQYQSLTPNAYPSSHTSSRATVPAVAPANPHYHQSMSMDHSSVARNVPTSRSAQLPYTRAPPVMSPVDYDTQTESTEPSIKKKRKRADARQLEVLNATYARTAFPSTEERAQLAKDLDMSARSVQIWFQNKRQSARQGGRNAANHPTNPAPPPVPTPTPPVSGYRNSPVLVSPLVEPSGPTYSSRSPPPAMMRSGATPSPPNGRGRADDPRRHWPSRGY